MMVLAGTMSIDDGDGFMMEMMVVGIIGTMCVDHGIIFSQSKLEEIVA
jgi:hypothetical protein